MGKITQKGLINGNPYHFTFNIELPDNIDVNSKALLMGAAMLIVSTDPDNEVRPMSFICSKMLKFKPS